MKVAILSTGVPSYQYPLNGIFAFDQAKALKASGIDICFLSVDLRSFRKRRPWGYTEGETENIKWYNISLPIGPISFIHKLISKRVVCTLYRRAFRNSKEPDIIHAHFAGDFAYILNKEYNIPYVITEHSSSVNRDDLSDDVIKTLITNYSNAEKVIAVSKTLAERIDQYTGLFPIIIPNIIDTRLFYATHKKSHQGFRIVTTSNLVPLKRTINIITTLPDVINECGDVHLDIIGDGIMKASLIETVRALNLSENVTFHGQLKRERIADLYESEDCFVLPSSTETFGVAYVEAMAAGLPVIATRCGGPEDFVNDSNGILIDVDDLTQLKEAIKYMYIHYKDYDAIKIKEDVTEKFSPEIVANRIKSIYEDILN